MTEVVETPQKEPEIQIIEHSEEEYVQHIHGAKPEEKPEEPAKKDETKPEEKPAEVSTKPAVETKPEDPVKEKAAVAVRLLGEMAEKRNVTLKLRKKEKTDF